MIRIGAKILFGLTRCPLLSSQLDLAVETDEQFVRQIHKGIDDEARSHPMNAARPLLTPQSFDFTAHRCDVMPQRDDEPPDHEIDKADDANRLIVPPNSHDGKCGENRNRCDDVPETRLLVNWILH
jgi:hypothetical protein